MRETAADPLDQVRFASSPEAWSTKAADLAGMAHDASHYLLRPKAILTPGTLAELVAALSTAHRAGQPVAFRAGGTSLSGQAGTDGILIDVRRYFDKVEVLDGGHRVRCAPGTVLRRVNAILARYGRKLGPDPASEIACTIGGVVANNSSGMTSGITATAYHTLDSIQFVLPSGTLIDTAHRDADAQLRAAEPDLHAGLSRLRDQIRSTPALRATIEHQFSMKNTMGYAVNAFLDHTEPVHILAHLMVGSEGTLGYIASVVLRTVPVPTKYATALLVLDSAGAATDILPGLLDSGARAAELMDAAALRVAQRLRNAPQSMKDLHVDGHAALLVEYQSAEPDELAHQVVAANAAVEQFGIDAQFSADAKARAAMWTVRKGLYAAVAGARRPGTTNLLEDIAVPPDALTGTVHGLTQIFAQYEYDDAVIFGHARDANLHFMITPNLDDPAELAGYEAFTEDMVDLVLGVNGTLKAEHGTGRIMSAYVRRQFGDELYAVMSDIKRLCDPHGILAPGVLLDDDPRAHVRNLKVLPEVNDAVDRCVDCGFCEPACPSRNTTTTPRRRIALLREANLGDQQTRAKIEAAYSYDAVQTCAADSLCARSCPVDIDTGAVMKSLRADANGPLAQRSGAAVAATWGSVTAGLRAGLQIADAAPSPLLFGVTAALRKFLPHDLVPATGADLPGPGQRRSALRGAEGTAVDAVFFPSCTATLFGPAAGGTGASAAFLSLSAKAGLTVALADRIDELCCGTPWASKGFIAGHNAMVARVADAAIASTDGGRLPLVCDAASCTHGLDGIGSHLDPVRAALWDQIQVIDAVAYVRRVVLPLLGEPAGAKLDSIVLHPTCATEHLGIGPDLEAVAGAVADQVTVPPSWGCCGFAGDRGMLHPELTAGATETEAAEIAEAEATDGRFGGYASCNRTCEMGISRATGRTYEHVLELADRIF